MLVGNQIRITLDIQAAQASDYRSAGVGRGKIPILGRYQLYTENTLPPVILVLTRLGSVLLLLRVWVWLLPANVKGAALGAVVVASSGVLSPGAATAGSAHVAQIVQTPWIQVFFLNFEGIHEPGPGRLRRPALSAT